MRLNNPKTIAGLIFAASFFKATYLQGSLDRLGTIALVILYAHLKRFNSASVRLEPVPAEKQLRIFHSSIQGSIISIRQPATTGMAPIFHIPYLRSTPNLPQNRNFISPPAPTALVPGPLRVFKRTSRNASPNVLPLSTLGEHPAEGSATSDSSSEHSFIPNPPASPSHNASVSNLSPTTYHSALSLPITASLTAPSTLSLSNGNNASLPPCSLCLSPLSRLQTYSFPQTAPAVTEKVRKLFPRMNETPIFCGTCFEAIHAVHLCWGCGNPVHREEERVGCGWAWWHWGCVRCLICRVRMIQPPNNWNLVEL